MPEYSAHALKRMRERRISKEDVEHALERPIAIKDTRYGRKVACMRLEAGHYLIIVFEESSTWESAEIGRFAVTS